MTHDRPLADRVIAITGGAAGIGFATAELCARAGASVALVDLSPERGVEAVRALKARGCTASFHAADVADEARIARAMDDAARELGPITGLVNNAGIAGFASVHEARLADWERILAVNVTGTFLASKAVLPGMLEAGHGSIVNLASVAGMVGFPAMPAYCAAKAAVIGLTRQMAADYTGRGIRVNCLCPGRIAGTELDRWIRELDSDAATEAKMAKYPIGRFGRPEEIARAALFLLSDEAGFVSGTAFCIDGGLTAI
jgi:NAD(P)-dependent dehydrogenase (short-subunit alcohol dehydrogenase family)